MKRFKVDLVSNRIRNSDIAVDGVTFDVALNVVGKDGGGSSVLQGREHYRRSGAVPSSSMTSENEERRTRRAELGMCFVRDAIGFCD